jgi:type IV secretory pathway TrbL component
VICNFRCTVCEKLPRNASIYRYNPRRLNEADSDFGGICSINNLPLKGTLMHKILFISFAMVFSLNVSAAEGEKSWWEGFKESVSDVFSSSADDAQAETESEAANAVTSVESVVTDVKAKAAAGKDAVEAAVSDAKAKAAAEIEAAQAKANEEADRARIDAEAAADAVKSRASSLKNSL